MDIRDLLKLPEGRTRPMRIAYAVNLDARLSWGGLPAPGRGLSSVRPDACHLMPEPVDGGPAAVRAGPDPGPAEEDLERLLHGGVVQAVAGGMDEQGRRAR